MFSRMKWGDFAIIGVVLALAAAMSLCLLRGAAGSRLYAGVYVDGELIERVALDDETDREINLNGHNKIVLKGRTARIQTADCRDQVCVRTGTLTRAGQAAVCLPNRVVLRLEGEKSRVDAVAL